MQLPTLTIKKNKQLQKKFEKIRKEVKGQNNNFIYIIGEESYQEYNYSLDKTDERDFIRICVSIYEKKYLVSPKASFKFDIDKKTNTKKFIKETNKLLKNYINIEGKK